LVALACLLLDVGEVAHLVLFLEGEVVLGRSSQSCPVLHVFIVVEVLTPLDKAVNVLFELLVINLHELLVVERILIQRFKLFLELS
jgi:hypothetical protein